MKKCKCGGTEFDANVVKIFAATVDSDGEIIGQVDCCLDHGYPEGPFTCLNDECGMEYDDLEDL